LIKAAHNGFNRLRRRPDCSSKSSLITHSVMYFGIGFVIAALLGLLAVLHVHRRATLQIPADIRQFDDQLTVALGERSKLLERDEFRFVHILSLPSSVSTVRV